MIATQRWSQKKNLLLCFDAFGTLFQPTKPIGTQYRKVARRHGIYCPVDQSRDTTVMDAFNRAFKEQSILYPNYGKAIDMEIREWWAGVIVNTFKPFLGKDVGKFSRNHSRIKQANAGLLQVPEQLVNELLKRFSSSKGYTMFPDVIPFFKNLKDVKQGNATDYHWPWEKTVVGIITNSDSRVPGILRDLGLKVGHRRVGNTNNHIKNKETDEADIDFVVLSYDVGAEKPDTRIFNAAEDMLKEMIAADESNIQAQSIDDFEKLYVGDDVEKDYYGARAAGWHALTVDAAPREQHYNRMDPQAIKGAKWALRPYKPKTEDENLNQQKAWRVLDLTALRHWDPSVYERETFVPKNEEQVPTADAVTSK